MSIKVLVNGAKGRMGLEVVKAVSADSVLELVAQTDMGDDLASVIKESVAEVVVDFTVASSVEQNLTTIIESGARPVVGTSGLTEEKVNHFKELCAKKNLGGLIAPNFAIGAVLMMKFARDAGQYMPQVEIIEMHHDKKEDTPSGTAVRTSEMIAEARGEYSTYSPAKETIPGACGASNKDISIHSVRLPGFVASQEVIFGGLGQTLSIRHDSLNRESFMPGVCLACRKVLSLKQLHYGLENIL